MSPSQVAHVRKAIVSTRVAPRLTAALGRRLNLIRRGGGRHPKPTTVGRYLTLPVLMLVLVGTGACSQTNLADVIAAAATDQATVCARVTSVYGTLTYLRTNIHGGDVACDTLGVKSTTNVAIPMTITPAFQVAPSYQYNAPDPFGPGTPPVITPQGRQIR